MIFPLCGCQPPADLQLDAKVGQPPAADVLPETEAVDAELAAKLLELEGLRTRIQRRKQRDNFSLFFKAAWDAMNPGTALEWGPHIQALCDHIQWQLEDSDRARRDHKYKLKVQNLLINVPPRSLKTKVLTYATVWAWVRWPDMRIMYLSANPRVAFNSARDARDLITSNWFQKTHEPTWKIRSDQNALTDLGNTAGGVRIGRGLDGAVTGEGAQWQIVDDPHDLRDSSDIIEKCIAGYDSAVGNRINDPRTAIRTCIMQRVNIADFSAHVLKQGWVHLRIPMEYESKPFCHCATCKATVNAYGWKDWRTVDGEALLPERFTPEFLAAERLRLGPHGYATQHQQRPSAEGGGRLRKDYWGFFRLSGHHAGDHPHPPGCSEAPATRTVERVQAGWNRGKLDLDWMVISVDAANKKTDRGSNYGLLAIGGKDMRRFLFDDRTTRGEFTEILEILRDMIVTWRPDKLLVEAKAAGPSLMSSLEQEMADGQIRGHDRDDLDNVITCGGRVTGASKDAPGTCMKCGDITYGVAIVCAIEGLEVDVDKERRVDAVLPQIAARVVYLLEGLNWDEFVEECALFPQSPWNDRVDALSQVLEAYRTGPFYVL